MLFSSSIYQDNAEWLLHVTEWREQYMAQLLLDSGYLTGRIEETTGKIEETKLKARIPNLQIYKQYRQSLHLWTKGA